MKIIYDCTITVRNKFDTFLEISETDSVGEEYEKFVYLHMEAAAECIPTKPRTYIEFYVKH